MPLLLRFFLIAPLLCLGFAPAAAQEAGASAAPIPPERLLAVERFVARNWSRLGLPGVAVSVATPDAVVLAVGHGSIPGTGREIDGNTPFHIGSVTKTLTAAVAAQLAHDGTIELDRPIESWLPEFSLAPPYVPGTLTPELLLRHRSGLSQWVGHDRRAQEEGSFGHLAPSRAPGERGEYSSLNFIIVGRVLEAAADADYASLLEDLLFEPLGMTSAFVEGSGSPPVDPAPGHQSWFGFQRRKDEPAPPRYLVPAGFAGASASDLGRYGGMLVGGGDFAGVRVLEGETVAAILGPLDAEGGALGWGRSRRDGTLVLGHSGNARTASARMRLVPGEGYALVVLSNTNSGPFLGATDALLDGIHAILRGEPEPRLWPLERGFKLAVLAGTVVAVVGMGRRARDWHEAGHPVGIGGPAVGRLAVDIGVGGAVLIGVPRYIGVPLPTLIEYFPDLGTAMVASAGAGIVGGVLRAFTRSAP